MVIVKDFSATLFLDGLNTVNVAVSIMLVRIPLQGTMIYTSCLRSRQLLHGLSIIMYSLFEVALGHVISIDVQSAKRGRFKLLVFHVDIMFCASNVQKNTCSKNIVTYVRYVVGLCSSSCASMVVDVRKVAV